MKPSLIIICLSIILSFFACKDKESDLPVVQEAPSKPVITSPRNDAFLGNCVNVVWNEVASAEEYRLQIGSDAIFSLNGSLKEEVYLASGTNRWLFDLQESRPTFARMKASNIYGNSDWSEIVTFIVDADTILTCTTPTLLEPNLISPANESSVSNSTITFEWGGVLDATIYHLQVAPTTNFTNLLYDNEDVFETQRIVQGINPGFHYYWRVKAKSNTETSPWSTKWKFTSSN